MESEEGVIFISCSSADLEIANRIMDYLRSIGYPDERLFLHPDVDSGIVAGSDWQDKLFTKLMACRCLISLCSEAWTESVYCKFEEMVAQSRCGRIIPLILDPNVDPNRLSRWQAIKGFDCSEESMLMLARALRQHGLAPPISKEEVSGWAFSIQSSDSSEENEVPTKAFYANHSGVGDQYVAENQQFFGVSAKVIATWVTLAIASVFCASDRVCVWVPKGNCLCNPIRDQGAETDSVLLRTSSR